MVESGELGELLMINVRLNDTRFVPTKLLSRAAQSSPLHFLGSHVVDNCWIVADNAPNVFEFKAEFIGTRGSTYVDASHRTLHRVCRAGYRADGHR